MTKIDIISGFLGAGKTTLIKKLLSEALKGEQVVLIENEFGEIGIDGGFLKDSGIEIREMNSGCICCSLVGDFGTSLKEVITTYHPDRIIIEPSGVGKLSDVIKAVKGVDVDCEISLNSYTTVADVNKCKMYMRNFGEFFNNQVEYAGAIIMSRTDIVDEAKAQASLELLREINSKAAIITTPIEQLPGEKILETMESSKSLEDELLAEVAKEAHDHEHHHHHDHEHEHAHEHAHDHHDHAHPEHAHAADTPAGRAVAIEEDILGRNNAVAAKNRALFAARKILALNLVSSPGAGKTELLAATLRALLEKDGPKPAVIEGDQETTNDADRIRSTGARAVQINTGKGCHLDASMVERAVEVLNPENDSILFIENVGNLVCPAEFDLGEAHKVALLAVTEGEDKPIKYPDMFRASDLMILTKVDLLPYLRFDVEKCEAYARRVNPRIKIIRLSATTGEGLDTWLNWLEAERVLAGI